MQPGARTRVLAALSLVAILAACGGGDDSRSAEDIEADIAAQLEEEGLPEDTASCVAGVIVDEIGVEELQDVDFSAEEPPADLQEEITAASLAAIDECDLGADGEQ
ncbi:MAG: hypothetical protein ACO1PW_00170 [Actinomycetota bacterium]